MSDYILGEPTVQQYFDVNGIPLVNGSIEFYVSGTSTPTPIYSDAQGTELGTSITLNSIGAPQSSGGTPVALFFDASITYKIVRKDSSGTVIAPTIDPYSAVKGGSLADKTFSSMAGLLASSGNSGYDAIYLKAYYPITYPSTEGPKGGHYRHRTSATGTPGTTSGGYAYDADGVGWLVSPDQYITPEIFGAYGDTTTGTDGNDDYLALQAAIDYLEANGGGVLRLLGGRRYRSSQGLTVTEQNIAIIGDGSTGVPIIHIDADVPGLTVTGARFVAKNWSLRSTQNSAGTATSYGLHGSGSTPYMMLENFMVSHFPGHGIYFEQVFVSTLVNVHSRYNGGFGFRQVGATSTTYLTTYALYNKGGGYSIKSHYMFAASMAADHNSGGPAYQFDECIGGSATGLGMEFNEHPDDGKGLVNFIGCRSFEVRGMFLTQNTGAGTTDGNSVFYFEDGDGYNLDSLRVTGVYVKQEGSPRTQYLYSSTVSGNACIELDIRGSYSSEFGPDNGIAAFFRRKYFDFWSTDSGGQKVMLLDTNAQKFLFGADAVANGEVDDEGGVGVHLDNDSMRARRDTANGSQVAWFYGAVAGGGVSYLLDTGAAFNTTGTWGQISDQTLKENITYTDSAYNQSQVTDIKALQLAKFNMIGQPQELLGLIAQDAQAVCPGIVESVPQDGGGSHLTIKSSVVMWKMLAAMQDLIARIEALETP